MTAICWNCRSTGEKILSQRSQISYCAKCGAPVSGDDWVDEINQSIVRERDRSACREGDEPDRR